MKVNFGCCIAFVVVAIECGVFALEYDLMPEPQQPPDYAYYDDWEQPRGYYDPVHMGRTRLGQGIFRMFAGGRDVELRCEFSTNDLVSNIVWERVTDASGRGIPYRSPYYGYGHPERFYTSAGNGMGNGYYGYSKSAVLQRSEGSSLFLRDVTPADAGLYRCLASRRVPQSVGRWAHAVETVFQDVFFFPGNYGPDM